jgi:hypothetical protein
MFIWCITCIFIDWEEDGNHTIKLYENNIYNFLHFWHILTIIFILHKEKVLSPHSLALLHIYFDRFNSFIFEWSMHYISILVRNVIKKWIALCIFNFYFNDYTPSRPSLMWHQWMSTIFIFIPENFIFLLPLEIYAGLKWGRWTGNQ